MNSMSAGVGLYPSIPLSMELGSSSDMLAEQTEHHTGKHSVEENARGNEINGKKYSYVSNFHPKAGIFLQF